MPSLHAALIEKPAWVRHLYANLRSELQQFRKEPNPSSERTTQDKPSVAAQVER